MHKQIVNAIARSHETRLTVCAYVLASTPLYQLYRQIVASDDAARLACVGALVDALIPDVSDVNRLLACALADSSLLTDEPEDYDCSNSLSPAVLLRENLYRQVFLWVETSLDDIARRAMIIRGREDTSHADHAAVSLDGE